MTFSCRTFFFILDTCVYSSFSEAGLWRILKKNQDTYGIPDFYLVSGVLVTENHKPKKYVDRGCVFYSDNERKCIAGGVIGD